MPCSGNIVVNAPTQMVIAIHFSVVQQWGNGQEGQVTLFRAGRRRRRFVFCWLFLHSVCGNPSAKEESEATKERTRRTEEEEEEKEKNGWVISEEDAWGFLFGILF